MSLDAAPRQATWSDCDRWLRRANELIAASAEALNAMNVFPVSDSDTGSNLKLTLAGIAHAVERLDAESADRAVQAAILSAHGNSGAIVAQMFTSVCHTLQTERTQPAGVLLSTVLNSVAVGARQAVARPVEGTILTVADEAARVARTQAERSPDGRLTVATAAHLGATAALAQTTEQLEVLREAGVVDSGGQAFVLLLEALVEVLGGSPAQPLVAVEPRVLAPTPPPTDAYEVMYTLRGADAAELAQLRRDLDAVGDSVVVVGDAAVAQVHVHLPEAGQAIQAALGLGQLSEIRVTALHTVPEATGRTVIAVVAGGGIARAYESMGARTVTGEVGQLALQQLTELVEPLTGEVVILPNDMEHLELAQHLAASLRHGDRRIAVIPTVAQIQGLAAMAVHEPSADFDSAVVAMSSAAGHARHGAVTIAESPAMTMAGRCQVGDVLGLVDGDFVEIGRVEIGRGVDEVAWRVIERLLATGGELLTLVRGVDCSMEVIDGLAERARQATDGLDIEIVDGEQSRYLILMGLE